jgi:hypothetical protein
MSASILKSSKTWMVGFFTFVCVYSLYVFLNSLPIVVDDIDSIPTKGKSLFVQNMVDLGERHMENWTPNDITIPHMFRDDIIHYQEGVWRIFRENAIILREEFSRNRTSGGANEKIIEVYNLMAIDTRSWMFPDAASEYTQALQKLSAYNDDVASGDALFRTAADNLPKLLKRYISVMGDVSTKLNHASQRETIDVENGIASDVGVDWFEIDDNFYKAQGIADAMLISMKGIQSDFAKVIQDKNGTVLVHKIIEDLTRCHFRPPFIFNGNPHNMVWSSFANHSLSLSSYIQHVRNRMASLHDMLENG